MDEPGECREPAGNPLPTEASLGRLFDLSLDILCIAGLDGYFKHVNPAFTRLLGYRAEDLLTQAFIEFVHPDDHEKTIAAVGQLAEGLDVVDFENRYRAADGAWRWLAWRATSVPDEGLIFATARDVTEHRLLQELAERQADELLRSNADLEQFASIASHDLQAPLRAVRNLADWIEEELPEDVPEKVQEYLTSMRDRVDQMTNLVTDLLAYSRVGRGGEKPRPIDTARLVATITELLAPPDGFEIIADPSLPTIETTQTALDQALRNLISNSIHHHDRDSGTITVSARDRGDAWEFRVTDDGPGIPAADQEKVFEMLWTSATGEHTGTGMGLALVQRIVENSGGEVWIESGEERGASLCFTWPDRIEE